MGRLDPNEDPDTQQKVTTTFEGRLRGDRFEGTFESVASPGGQRTGGTWSVTRKPPAWGYCSGLSLMSAPGHLTRCMRSSTLGASPSLRGISTPSDAIR